MNEAPPQKSKKPKYLIFGLLLLSGCALALYLKFVYFSPRERVHRDVRKIQAAIDPEELRLWAADLAGVHPKGVYLIKQDVLKTFKTLEKDSPNISIGSGNIKDNGPYAMVFWKTDTINWGIFIGPTNYHLPADPQAFHDVKWVDGIYFRHEGNR